MPVAEHNGFVRFDLYPSSAAKTLWIRVRATDENLAGNITKITIPAKARLQSDAVVTYEDKKYTVSGLDAGTYCYVFTDTQDVTQLSDSFTVAEGETITLDEPENYTYLALVAVATEEAFESLIRYLVTVEPGKEWVVNSEEKNSYRHGRGYNFSGSYHLLHQ